MLRLHALFLSAATLALAGLGAEPDAQALARQLKSDSVPARIEAAKALNALSPNVAPVARELVAALKDDYFDVRENACEALRKLGPAAVPPLSEALKDDSYYMQLYAARTLGRIGPAAKEAVPALGELLTRADNDVRGAVVEAIEAIGDPAPAAAALLSALSHPNEGVRATAARALAKAGKTLVPEIAKLLTSSDPGAVAAAALALAEIGRDAASSAPALVKLLLDECERARRETAAIDSVGIRESRLRHAVRESVYIPIVGKMGAPAAPFLRDALRKADELKVWWVLEALGKLGPAARVALPELTEALKGSADPNNRARAAGVIGGLGLAAESAIPLLAEAMQAKEEIVSRYAAGALAKMGAKGVAALLAAMKNPEENVRKQAEAAVKGLGPDAQTAVPVLREALKDGDEAVRAAAAAALKNIQ